MCNKLNAVMKKQFFHIVAALALICGVFAFTGCTDFEKDINDLNDRLEALETGKIADLESQIKTLQDALNAANGAIDALEALDIQGLKDQLAALQATVDGIDLSNYVTVEDFENLQNNLKALQDIVDGIDLDKYATLDYANGTFATKDDVAALETALGALEGSLDALKEKVAGLEEAIASLDGRVEGLEGLFDVDTVKISEILVKIDAAQQDASEALGRIASLEDAFNAYVEVGKAYRDSIETVLDGKLDKAEFLNEFNAAFDNALGEALADGGEISAKIAEEINKAVEKINTLFRSRLTSISLIPEMYIDGTPTIPFYTVSYNAKKIVATGNYENWLGNKIAIEYAIDDPDVAKSRNVSLKNTVARYHVSPDGLTKSDIGTPEYLIEEVWDLKSAETNPFFTIESYDFVNGELQVQLKKNTTDGDVIDSPYDYLVHTAALKVPIAEKNLVDGEKSAAVYSEYSKIGEFAASVEIASLYDLNRDQTSGKYECLHEDNDVLYHYNYHFYDGFFDAATTYLPAKNAHYSENFDLNTMVTGCLSYNLNFEDVDDPSHGVIREITKEELAELGFEFRFSVPELLFEMGLQKTNQQEFGKVVDGHYLQPVAPGGATYNRASIGRTPVVRVELIDTNNDDAIIDVAYFRIGWVENEIPTTVIEEPIKTFEYILSCDPFEGRLTWDEINALVLSKIGEDGISHDMFYDAYYGGDLTIEPTDERPLSLENFETSDQVIIYWDKWDGTAPSTSVFGWSITTAGIGDVIDELLAGEEVKYGVTVTVYPNSGAATYAGTQTFTLEVIVKLPELPELTGTSGVNWTIKEELLRVYPVLYGQHDPNISTTVYYRQILNQFFNVDASKLFVSNIVPTTAQINAAKQQLKANGDPRDLASEWACRGWDLVYAQNQAGLKGYGPNKNNTHQLVKPAGNGTAASNITPETTPWLRTNAEILLDLENAQTPTEEAKWLLNRNRLQDLAKKHYESGVTDKADIAKYGEDFKYVTMQIVSRINDYNYYTVHTFDAWFVSPLAIDVTVTKNFTDQVIGGSKINVADAFKNTKDFNGDTVSLTPTQGEPEALRQYYAVEKPEWNDKEARISLVNNGGSLEVDNSLDANIAADLAKMQKLEDLRKNKIDIRVEYEEATDELVFYADNGWAVENDVNIWVPVTVKHKWGEETVWAKIVLKPASSTSK